MAAGQQCASILGFLWYTAHPASYTVVTGGSFSGGKARPGRDGDHSPPSSVEVKKE
jgi:hypothetical protein